MITFNRAIRLALAEFERNGCTVSVASGRVAVREPVGSIELYHYNDRHVLNCLETFRARPDWRAPGQGTGAADTIESPGAGEPARLVAYLREKVQRLESKLQSAEQDRDLWRHAAEIDSIGLSFGAAAANPDRDSSAQDSFSRAKRAFARLYHPDRLAGAGGLEKLVRAEVFREFWTILEQIERENAPLDIDHSMQARGD